MYKFISSGVCIKGIIHIYTSSFFIHNLEFLGYYVLFVYKMKWDFIICAYDVEELTCKSNRMFFS
jgi:hypothetical protein